MKSDQKTEANTVKKIIKGKVYNSETAKKLSMRWMGLEHDREGWEELYQKKTGEFFLLTHRYRGQEENITPMTYEDAAQWAEKHLTGDDYEEIFGEIDENEETVRTTISTSTAELEIIKRNAAKEGMTVSSYIVMKCTE